MTLSGNKRLVLLIAVASVLAVVWVVFQVVPWMLGGRAGEAVIVGDTSGAPAELVTADSERAAPAANPGGNPSASGRPVAGSSGGRGAAVTYAEVARIANRPRPEDAPTLRQGAESPSRQTRELAIVAMADLGKDGDPDLLVRKLREDPSPEVRAAAAEGLGKLKYMEGGPALIDALSDPDLGVRSRAAASLRRMMSSVDFGYRADDEPAKRRIAAERIRQWWPQCYEAYRRQSLQKGTAP